MDDSKLLCVEGFWDQLDYEIIVTKNWQCSDLKIDLLAMENSSELSKYPDLTNRRKKAVQLKTDPAKWAALVIRAINAIALRKTDQDSQDAIGQLKNLYLYNTLKDFAIHSHFFEMVSRLMAARGFPFVSQSQNHSFIHDMDKLDPVMLVAYAEKFDDGLDTCLWKTCVTRHVSINLHHQDHPDWLKFKPEYLNNEQNIIFKNAIREMVCDKVSRKLQKEMLGRVKPEMWDIDEKWFGVLPPEWLAVAREMLMKLKNKSTT